MGIMHIVWTVIVGFVVGLLARAIMPGADHMGFIATSVLGIVGSFVGGFLGSVLWKPREGQSLFHPAGFFLSVIGAVILLFVWHHLQ